ncbi:MAG: electron transfer flavoprotein subunit alpha/FixB family protein [Candidatus Thermoplasmatota archaeon]
MVLVYSDDHTMMLELLGKASELAQILHKKVYAVLIGKRNEHHADTYGKHGADKILLVDSPLDTFKAEEYTEILEHIIREHEIELVMIGSNKNGKELAPRLAAKLNTGCVTDCTNISVNNGKITVQRTIYSGNAVAVEEFMKTPALVTIPPKTFTIQAKNPKHQSELLKKSISIQPSSSKILNIQATKTEGVSVEDADIIVSCGRGIKKKEDIQLINELAETLKGKTIGCSRPIAADLKWLSEDHWIGLSGHKVKPKLYIATGISGQIQHIAGMRDSGIVVAINKDPEALIFRSADYGIVGDLYEVIPKLTQAIKEKMK